MGVPKFYRWISERYPKINQIVTDNALLPEVDHLYLDLNGIIHGCTHPSHMDISDVISERDMMMGIMQYLDRIITQIAKPKVSVYMAIDGVAPRAKLNQQRSRRFRSAKDLAEASKDLPKGSAVFDSNCITPGTEFLEKVSATITYFIRKKIKEDPLWRNLSVIFSGHDVPGEGEHKIMQHIREMRVSAAYQPNTRHCIYGQDADLIMLALVTHEPHFVILREVVDFNFSHDNKNTLKAVKKFTKESDFQLLHISILREYLQIEFCKQGTSDSQYDLERTIDDFVFMTFLVGNDFLPHMPTLDIGDGAFDLLFSIYSEQRPSWGPGNYLTSSGEISDASRLEVFLAAIGKVENDILVQREKDSATLLKKKRRWDKRDGRPAGPSDSELKRLENEKQVDYATMIERMLAKVQLGSDGDDNDDDDDVQNDFVDGWSPVTMAGQKDFKGRYYFEKLKFTPMDKGQHWTLRKSYMEGLIWCLAYYYKGCISWSWYYPFHYGPMLSDLLDLPNMFKEISFEEGAPFTPFEQLMGCLPPASSQLVPSLYRWLMTSPDSPIIRFYPQDFEVDMNGKKNPWEGVNLLPFIDAKLLKDTIAQYCPSSKLSEDEKRRNLFGNVVCYQYDMTCTDTVSSPNKTYGVLDIVKSHSSMIIIGKQKSTGVPFKPELIPGTRIPYPGFPSLNVIPIENTELIPIGVNCFGSSSKYPTMLLNLYQIPTYSPLHILAENILGKSVFVNWPMMHEGKVVAISDQSKSIRLVKGKRKTLIHDEAAANRWASDAEMMYQMYYAGNGIPGSGGVNIGEVRVRLKLLPLQGLRMNCANGSTKKLFGREEADVPLQLALFEAPAPDPRFIERGPLTLEDRFPVGCKVVLTKGKYRGCKGIVVGIADAKCVGVKVETFPPELPFGLAIARTVQETYISSFDAARTLKMPPEVFGKVTGRLQFEQDKYDLGLNLKSAEGVSVVGYTRKKVESKTGAETKSHAKESAWSAGDSLLVVGSARSATKAFERNDDRIQWEFSTKAVRLVQEYGEKFPQLFSEIKKSPNEKKYDAKKVFGSDGKASLPIVREWLDKHATAKLPRTPITSESLSSEAVAAIQKAADVRSLALKKRGYPKESLIKIPGTALYREGCTGATDVLLAGDLSNERPELGDRIVNLCADGIPFGARGTVVAIHEASTTGSVEVVMDEQFVGGSTLQGMCSNYRGKLCVWAHLLKVAPENSKSLVDKLVPKGAGRAAVEKIMSSIEREVKNSKVSQVNNYWDNQNDPNIEKATDNNDSLASQPRVLEAESLPQILSQDVMQPEKLGQSPRMDTRVGSNGLGRQGAWREARGPDKSLGFKDAKKGKSGIAHWKEIVLKDPISSVNSSTPTFSTSEKSSAKLKAMLGISLSSADVSDVSSTSKNVNSDDEKLKAILGVNRPAAASLAAPLMSTHVPFAEAADAAAGLKAMLGVSTTSPRLMVPQVDVQQHQISPRSTKASTAAEQLLHLMANKQSGPPVAVAAPHSGSAFNFTYVEVDKEASPSRDFTHPLSPPSRDFNHSHPPAPPLRDFTHPHPSAPPSRDFTHPHPPAPYPMMSHPYQNFPNFGLPPGAMPLPPIPVHPYGYSPSVGYPLHPNGPMSVPYGTYQGGTPARPFPPRTGPWNDEFPPLSANHFAPCLDKQSVSERNVPFNSMNTASPAVANKESHKES